MAGPERTQKEIAQSYRGNLAYLRKFHFFRTLRGACFILAVLGSVGLAVGYKHLGFLNKKEFFTTGPLSAQHQKFANRCEQCHTDADPDLLNAVDAKALLDRAKGLKLADVDKVIKATTDDPTEVSPAPLQPKDLRGHGAQLGSPRELLASMRTLGKYDAACIVCHAGYEFHMPSRVPLELQDFYKEINVVRAGSCSSCHKEHQGPEKMPLPPSNNCRSCHNDLPKLNEQSERHLTNARRVSPNAVVHTVDGVRRFIPPRETPHQPAAFPTFAANHPSFGYEGSNLLDPGQIHYNHNRHAQLDVQGANGGKALDCTDCHKLGADGLFMQRVSYNNDCRRCHSLTFDPEVPELEVPHGRPDDVRSFLNGLAGAYLGVAVNSRHIPREQAEGFVASRIEALRARLRPFMSSGIDGGLALERRIFYVGDTPPTERITTKSNTSQVFPACTKCHVVKEAPPGLLPIVAPTNIPDRWMTRGPFTHGKHLHMQCIDCHASALASQRTSDINLPSKASCAECHRPLTKVPEKPAVPNRPLAQINAELVIQQRQEGGIAAECQSCHGKFHATEAAAMVSSQLPKAK